MGCDTFLAVNPNHIPAVMEESTKDKVQGKINDLTGQAKEKVGEATDNPNLQEEGQDDSLKGKVQSKIGDVKKVFEKP